MPRTKDKAAFVAIFDLAKTIADEKCPYCKDNMASFVPVLGKHVHIFPMGTKPPYVRCGADMLWQLVSDFRDWQVNNG